MSRRRNAGERWRDQPGPIAPRRAALLCAGLCLASAGRAAAQTDFQVWGSFSFEKLATARRSYGLEIEGKDLVARPPGADGWAALEVSPNATLVVAHWFDATGELYSAYTKQSDRNNSYEFTPRIGARIHLLSRDLPALLDRGASLERRPRHRVVIEDHLRLELRTLFYNNGSPTSSYWRLRNRVSFDYPLNRANITEDGARYVAADWELFLPLNGDASERYVNKERFRFGFGWRQSLRWRYEGLYVVEHSRKAGSADFTIADAALEVRVKRVF